MSRSQAEVVRSFMEAGSQTDQRAALPVPSQALLPIHISLPEFVVWATKNGSDSLSHTPAILRYVEQLPSASRLSFTAKNLLALCRQIGCLVVLDGFDEVGATRDRAVIVHGATELLLTLRSNSVSTQFLITTRPQGYSGEMSRLGLRLQEQTLLPLEKGDALKYAEKLIQAKIDGADQRQMMLDRVVEAANEPATQRLLTTPLQVTILTALIQHMGRAPRERWNLFESYFSYTYIREIERGSYASALLRDHRSHVEQIHARIALILQVESEQQGGTAGITKARLEEVISTVLGEEEVPQERRKELVREISKAAEERLVFLVEPEPGKFGFEIRSLQEFMAAQALTAGRDASVENRIKQISRSAMFRNTTLFCASRFFSEASPLRDFFIDDVCASLDDPQFDSASAASKAGALLALETLEEGAVLTQPKRAKLLMERAAGLLEIPPSTDHVRLSKAKNPDTTEVLESKLLQHFAAPNGRRKFNNISVWLTVLEALAGNEPWAEEIAEKNANELVISGELIDVFATCNLQVGLWLARKLESLPLAEITQFFVNSWSYTEDAQKTWLAHIERVFGAEQFGRRRRGHPHINTIGAGVPLTPNAQPDYPIPIQWDGILAITDFEQSPSAKNLSKALRSIVARGSLLSAEFLVRRASWPLTSCLSHYETSSALLQCAKDLDANRFLDAEQWIEWERGWLEKPFDAIATLETFDKEPLDASSRLIAPPFALTPAWIYIEHTRTPRAGRAVYEAASRLFGVAKRVSDKSRLGEICLAGLEILPSRFARENYKPLEWIELVPNAATYLALKPRAMKQLEWLKVLDNCATDYEALYIGAAFMSRAVHESSYHPTIVRIFVSTIHFYAQHLFTREEVPFEGADDLAIEIMKRGNWNLAGTVGADLALIVLLAGNCSTELDRPIVAKIIAEATANEFYWQLLVSAISLSRLPGRRGLDLMVLIYRDVGRETSAASAAMRFIRAQLQKAVSNLGLPHTWDRLALPLPRPRDGREERKKDSEAIAPVGVRSILLKDVAGISNLKLEFTPPASGGQWVIILGENGTGKSTILKSLALGLRNVRDPVIWPKGAFSNSWIRLANDSESPVVDASITIELGGGEVFQTVIRIDDSQMTVNQIPELEESRACPLYAYGCRRGSALGGGARAVNVSEDDGPEVATLFDSDANLIHAETWLVSLEGDAIRSELSRKIFSIVCSALKILLGLSDVEIKDQKVWVSFTGSPKIPLSALSDGYLISAGWFLDLVSRWLVATADSQHEVPDDFLSRMTGLVLIDEIDLHLHPRWQVDVIARTKKLLPNMSFIVSTHNPLTLVGSDASEIFILERDESGVRVSPGVANPSLLSGGQLYSRYFGIEDIYPVDTARDVQRFGFLTGMTERTAEEELELVGLKSSLAASGFVADEFVNQSSDPMQFLLEND
ncbi:AAA family ATPase [Variovorax sp. H27-G14]|uniref:AAA family ATPase n=1 Tax=Variovorax sp. H27-G14 TaxID=3111914 RepID=UPI0038FCB40E